MLLVDQHADMKLVERLEHLRADPKPVNCIELAFSQLAVSSRPKKEELLKLFSRVFAEQPLVQLYFSRNGDIYIMGETLMTREMRQLSMLLPVSQYSVMKHYELGFQMNTLLVQLEAKIEESRLADEEEKKRSDALRHSYKRQVMNDFKPDANWAERQRTIRHTRTQHEVMIIEDDLFTRRLLEKALPAGVNVSALGDPMEVLERYTITVPDVVFLDINLPDVNGHDVLRRILELDPNAYVIMISGNSDRENVVRAMSEGARGFIAKPFARERLFDYLQRCPTMMRT